MKLPLPKRLRAVIKLHGTPLMLIDRAKLIEEYKSFRRLLPRVRLFYAIKANPHPDIIRTFAEQGGGFDVASEGEMRLVLAQGVSPDRIIFANTIKRPEALEFARKSKVNFVTFDNEPELYKIAKHSPGCRVLARLKVGNLGSIVELSLKFGADEDQVVPMLLKAKSLGLKPEGISFHVGSQCTQFESYQRAFEQVHRIVTEADQRGLPIKMIDIGGGFPIRHFRSDTTCIETFASKMRRELDRLFPKEIDIIAEPGRALVGPAGMLMTPGGRPLDPQQQELLLPGRRRVRRFLRHRLRPLQVRVPHAGEDAEVREHPRGGLRAIRSTPSPSAKRCRNWTSAASCTCRTSAPIAAPAH